MAIEINRDLCVKCGGCVGVCPVSALELTDILSCDNIRCIKCKTCVRFCPVGALELK